MTADAPKQARPEPSPRPAAPERAPLADPAPQAARPLDPAVADVLRGEAEFEAKQRARDESTLETQQELGLFGPSVAEAVPSRAGASSLPDIDDISSTLEPIETGRSGQSELPQTDAARKRSFLSGMAVPLVVAVVLTGLYMSAPALARAVPPLDGVLSSYVALVDTARLAVSGLLGSGS